VTNAAHVATTCVALLWVVLVASCGDDDVGSGADAGPLRTYCGAWTSGAAGEIPCGAEACGSGQQCCVNATFVDAGASCWVLGCTDVGDSTEGCGSLTQCTGLPGQCGSGEFCCYATTTAPSSTSQSCTAATSPCETWLCESAAACPPSLPYCYGGLESSPSCHATPEP